MESLKRGIFAIVDTETTGMSPSFNGIIEIGILRIEEGKIVKRYQTLIRPERTISHTITGITGITNADLDSAPSFSEVSDDIFDLLDGAVLVAHNARFDYGFIKGEFTRLGRSYSAKTLCTVKLSRLLFPQHDRHNLDALIERYGITCVLRHRAMGDAQVLWEFLIKAEEEVGSEVLEQSIQRILKRHTLPAGLSPDVINSIPNRPGVYILYGIDKEVLYVGKSVTMRSRVLSHFSGDYISGKEMRMCSDTVHVEYIETSGELSALFLESKKIKELMPTYNRALRKVKQLVVIRKEINERGYVGISLEYTGEIDPNSLESVLAVCRSKVHAKAFLRKMVKEHKLCNKMLGIEKGDGSCFNRQLEICKGACSGREKQEIYNKRTERAFARYRLHTWPFKGPILIKDETEERSGVAYVIYNWCLTEMIEYCDGSQSSEKINSVFDLDSYKIVMRYLKDKKKSSGHVVLLPQNYIKAPKDYMAADTYVVYED